MAQIEVERFLGRLLTDDQFRRAAAQSAPRCTREYDLSPAEIHLLTDLDLARFETAAGVISDSLKRG